MSGDELTIDEIEAAYQRALETAEAAEALFPDKPAAQLTAESPELDNEPVDAISSPAPIPSARASSPAPSDALDLSSPDESLSPRQVIEALLFVGGDPLPARKICDVLGGSLAHERVDELVDDLNRLYAEQCRPYEIRLIEGGYRMFLRPEFESVRQKVYGQGPKEVKLAQDALEILALVAYRQPVSREDLEATDKKNVASLLRQLLRRELIALDRHESPARETYRTTPRFLQLFGLGSIDDLPQAVDFEFK